MQITLERQSKTIALSFNTDNSIAYDELYLAVQDKMSAIVNGGKFLASVVGKAFTIIGNAVSVLSKNIYVQGLTVAAAGGLGSRLAGGSFELGFLTAGLAFAVNQVVTELAQQTTSAAGRDFIKGWEGFSSSPYKILDQNGNPTGRWTVGYGHEITDAEYQSGQFNNISRAQGAKLLATDLAVAEASVHRFIANNNASISLSQNQFDALVSLTFNSGYIGRFPNLSANFASGNHAGVATQFLDITNGGVPGLVSRRSAEVDLYLNGSYSGRP